jgi:hypothetical protein
VTYLAAHPGLLIWTGVCLAAATAAGLAWLAAAHEIARGRQQRWRRRVAANVRAIRATPTPGPGVPQLPETGADENWSPLRTIGAQPVSEALMTIEERVDALRSGTPLPVDLDGEAYERHLCAQFDRLIDSTVALLPDDERLAFEQFRLRVRVRGPRTEATGQFSANELERMLAADGRDLVGVA